MGAAEAGDRRAAGAGRAGDGARARRRALAMACGGARSQRRRAGESKRRRPRPNWPSNVCKSPEAQAKEREQTELAEQRLYDVRMNLVQRYWEDYDGELFQQGLDEQLPANQGGIDRRGFEWFYWQRKIVLGAHHPQGAHRRGHERGVQPRRQAARLRQCGRDGEGVGRRDRAGNPHPQGAHRPVSAAWRSAPTASGSPPPARIGR